VAPRLLLTRILIRLRIPAWLPRIGSWLEEYAGHWQHYSDRLLAAPVDSLRMAALLLKPRPSEVIDLGQGSPHFDLVPSASTKLPADQRGWPPPGGLLELREAVARRLSASGDREVAAEDVLITAGASTAFHLVLEAFVNPGDRVVLFDPTSPLFWLGVRQQRGIVRWVTTWMEEGQTRFREQQLARAMRNARLIVVNSPANPTGGILTASDLERIAWWARRRDVLIFDDEVYQRYVYGGERASIGASPDTQQRTLTAGSLSMGHGLAAARVGWLAGCKPLIQPCAVSAALSSLFVPTLCQKQALQAFQEENRRFQAIHAEFELRRRYAFERLRAMERGVVLPGGGFFLWFPVWDLGLSGRQFADQCVRQQKVAVTPGDLFGPSGKGMVRISYALEEGRLREGLSRLEAFIHSLKVPGLALRKTAA
jgi:aspartate/methionine/tyrosine aminotransferase